MTRSRSGRGRKKRSSLDIRVKDINLVSFRSIQIRTDQISFYDYLMIALLDVCLFLLGFSLTLSLLIVSSSLDAMIRIWDVESGKQIKSIDASPGRNNE
jgi:WD40 repeat protein